MSILVTPEQFGAAGDGVTDDTAALNQWSDSLGGGTNGLMENIYLISSTISIFQKSGFTIAGGGSVKIADGTPITEPYSGFFIQQSSDWSMSSITIDGNRSNRPPGPSSGHSVKIRSCSGFELKTVTCLDGPVDGIVLDASDAQDSTTHCRDFRILDCVSRGNTRQGLSIIQAHDFSIIGGEYSLTDGALPGCGIDLEPNDGGDAPNSITNGTICGVLFQGNSGCGLQVSGKTTNLDIYAVNLIFDGNVDGAIRWGARTGVIAGAVVRNTQSLPTRGQIDVIARNSNGVDRGGYVYIVRPRFEAIAESDAAHPLIYEHKSAEPIATVVDVDVDEIEKAYINLRGAGSILVSSSKIKLVE